MADAAADPVTLTVIQATLAAAADEMFSVLRKTAMSPIIYEVLDVGTGITDAGGRLVSSGAGIPTFVGVLDKAVRRILEVEDARGSGGPRPGDVFITNDPAYGGVTHLNDVVLAMPVFAEGRCIAWAASIAHWNDIGGMVPGSMATGAREIFAEGLRLPAVRLFHGGAPVEPVFQIIAANSRLPDFVRGDLWAQIAAARAAARRIEALAVAHGAGLIDAAIEALFREGEARARTGLGALPTGRHALRVEQDDGSVWPVAVEITADRFLVDLRDAPDQRQAPHNTSRDGAVIAAQMIFKALCDPSREANDGSFRPLEVLTRPGSIFDAQEPAPHGFYYEVRIALLDALWRCLARAMPDRLPAGHFASICGTVIAGRHPDTGRPFTMVEPQMGGWGGSATDDGLDAMYSACHGDTFNCPAEIAEARYGLQVEWRRLDDRAAPASSRHPGGRGLSTCYALRGPCSVSAGYGHTRIPAWGLAGGDAGGHNTLTIHRRSGTSEEHAFVSGLPVDAGERIAITTAAGGGWGSTRQGTG